MPDTKVQQDNTTNIQEKPLEQMTQAELFVYAQALLKENEKLAAKRVKYGLVWEDHDEDIVKQCQENVPVLQEVKARFVQGAARQPKSNTNAQLDAFETIESPDNETLTPTENINHILIEADNYHALSVLNYTHKGKIDVIYIDPPYNTENEGFIYNDKLVDKNDNFRHSKWISFMEKRLKLAKELLKDTGIIFISIDDNEVANLKLLANKVLGEDNFVGQWNWFKSATPPNLSKKIKKNIEYIFCYQKTKNEFKFKGVQKNSTSDDPITKPQNTIKELRFLPNSLQINIGDTTIKAGVYGTDKYPNELLNDLVVKDGTNFNEVIFKNKFTWLQSKLDKEFANGTRVSLSKNLVISYKKAEYGEEVPPNFINNDVGVDTTENAGKDLSSIFEGKKVFDYPKPVSLIKYLVGFLPIDNPLILDFFAGSGTTAHAVMQLNAEDGGNRQCILVTNNENKICEEVTFERCRRVIEGYTTPKGETIEGLEGNNLRYFKTDFVPYTLNSDQLRFSITGKCTEMLCLRENVFDLFAESKAYKIYKEGDKHVAIYYDMYSLEFEQLRDVMNGIEGEKILYFFSLDREPNLSDFSQWKAIKIEPIPQKILDLYRQLFKERKP